MYFCFKTYLKLVSVCVKVDTWLDSHYHIVRSAVSHYNDLTFLLPTFVFLEIVFCHWISALLHIAPCLLVKYSDLLHWFGKDKIRSYCCSK